MLSQFNKKLIRRYLSTNKAATKTSSTISLTTHPSFDIITHKDLTADLGDVTATLYRHKATGAEILSMKSEDTNKVFGVTFGTPSNNSTGVAHILEHSVLCGGKKYPLKEPFVELLKGSMNTFLNAFTYPDRTCYPVASTNLKDFYNLIDVYVDAVFFPNITELTFKQEGWHYAPDETDPNTLIYRGVVFNEMKGVYSQPDSLVHRHMSSAMYPNPKHIYGLDSGGDPSNIPDLSYAAFKQFHNEYYRPSNARIFFFGNDPESERLKLMDEAFTTLKEIDPDRCTVLPRPKPPIRPLKDGPGLRLKIPYMVDEEDMDEEDMDEEDMDEEDTTNQTSSNVKTEQTEQNNSKEQVGQHYGMLGWILNETSFSLEDSIVLGITNDLLVGNSSATLYRDVMNSKLGTAFIGGGLSDELQQCTFSVGLKGMKASNMQHIEQVIHDSLQNVVDNGFQKEAIQASVNSTEFSLLEFNTGGIPRGLSLMLASNPCWLYNDDPFSHLEMKTAMRQVRTRVENNEPIFENMVSKYLINNKCQSFVELVPDRSLGARQKKEEEDRLKTVRANMNDIEYQQVIDQQVLLLEHQSTPDPPEIVSMIPNLQVTDLNTKILTVPREIKKNNDYNNDYNNDSITNNTNNTSNTNSTAPTVLIHEIPETNGIVYVDIVLDANDVDMQSLAWLPLFTTALTQTGTNTKDEASLTFQIGTDTGGIGASTMFSAIRDVKDVNQWSTTESVHKIVVRGKATVDKVDLMFTLMNDVLVGANFNNRERLTEIIHRNKEAGKSMLLSSGHSIAGSRLTSKLTKIGSISEQMGGLTAYDYMNNIDIDSDAGWKVCNDNLESIRTKIVQNENVIINITSDKIGIHAAESSIAQFMNRLPSKDVSENGESVATLGNYQWSPLKETHQNEGYVVASQVNYVVQGGLLNLENEISLGAASVVSRYLRNTWLWDEVRVKGGAYGGFCSFDSISNVFQYGSYRDPNLQNTIDAYGKSPEFLQNVLLDENEVTKGIVGAVSDMDTPRTPATRGYTDMLRHLVGENDANRQQYRDEVLSTSKNDFRLFGEKLQIFHDDVNKDLKVVVVGSSGSLDEMKEKKEWKVKKV